MTNQRLHFEYNFNVTEILSSFSTGGAVGGGYSQILPIEEVWTLFYKKKAQY